MKHAKYLKILFLLAGMILSVKPIIGFGIIGHAKEEAAQLNYMLLQKLFSKRKQDYLDDDLVEIVAIQRRLSDADLDFVWQLCNFILGIIAPILVFAKATQRFLRELFLLRDPHREIYLSTGKLTI